MGAAAAGTPATDDGKTAQPSAQATTPAQSDSLIPTPTPEGQAAATTPAAKPRPEHIPEKFWDATKGEANIEHLAKSYAHLETRLGAFKGAPAPGEDGKVRYELKLPEGVEGLDPADLAEDPLWVGLQDLAAKNNVSQEFVEQLAGHYFGTQARANMANKERELTQLRFAGWSDAKLADFGRFWASQFDTAEEFQEFQELTRTASGVLTLERIRNKMLGTKMLPTAQQGAASTDDITAEYDRALSELSKLSVGSPEWSSQRAKANALVERLAAARR